MKTLHWLIIDILCLILSACSSNDEPDAPYTGPWEIHYFESYVGLHNNSKEFEHWFNSHTQYFVEARFSNYTGTTQMQYTDYIELDDYKNYFGEIYWLEIVPKATEDEIKQKIADFESFTVIEDLNTKSDIFQAKYQRHEVK